jgi:hypothetical protein
MVTEEHIGNPATWEAEIGSVAVWGPVWAKNSKTPSCPHHLSYQACGVVYNCNYCITVIPARLQL